MDSYKDFALGCARKAGKIMRDNFSLGMKKEWKLDNTPLTITDTKINHFVITSIKEMFPTHAVLGEEESALDTNSEYIWVCDPVDGTIPFSHGIPVSTFSLALTYKGESILGVIYDPYMERLLIAEKGKGAFLNDKKISVSTSNKLNHTVVAMEYWNTDIADCNYAEVRQQLMEKGAKIISFLSYVYSGMLVAAGEFSAATFAGKTPWDAAAVKIIVEEAGGTCTDIFGNDQKYNKTINGLVASNGLLHEQIISIFKASTVQ